MNGKPTLRKYQEQMLASLREQQIAGHSRLLLLAPTGSGKTILAAAIIQSALALHNSVVFITHRQVLAEQSLAVFQSYDIPASLWGAGQRDTSTCTVAMLQTVYRDPAPLIDADLVIVDEVHYGWDSTMINAVLSTIPTDTVVIGLSATPITRDGHLLPGFDAVTDIIQTTDLIDAGFLVRPRVITALSPDLSRIPVRAGDYIIDAIDRVMRESIIAHDVVDSWLRHAPKRKTVVYCVTCDHADDLAAQFAARGVAAESYHSNMPDDQRRGVMGRFELGMTQVVTNVDMLTTGWDDPTVNCIVLARPTKSEGYYLQMVGRGLRPMPGKYDCIVLDCACCVRDCGMPTDRRTWRLRPMIGCVADRVLGLERADQATDETAVAEIPEPIQLRLREVSSLLDMYADKTYLREADLLNDCRTILKRGGWFFWRQNSGVLPDGAGHYVHFTDKKGLPDLSIFIGPVYVGIELKIRGRPYQPNQRATLPEMYANGLCIRTVEHPSELVQELVAIEQAIIDGGDTLTVHKAELAGLDQRTRKLIDKETALCAKRNG